MNTDLTSLKSIWTTLASTNRYRPYLTSTDFLLVEEGLDREGLTFLTKTLPTIGKALDSSFSVKGRESFENFLFKDGEPILLRSAFKLAWENSDPRAVDCIRQLAYAFYKLEVPYEEKVVEESISKFLEIDISLPEKSKDANPKTIEQARLLIAKILNKLDPYDIVPRHSSGATACKTRNSEKYHLLRYYAKLDEVFDYSTFFFVSPTHLVDQMRRLETAETKDPLARLIAVPKDSKGPRLISCEPSEMMYIQQGLMTKLYGRLETSSITAGKINFSDQTINQRLAREGSIKNSFATLDLSEASDRVSLDLVVQLFPDDWVIALLASRSEGTVLPDGRIHILNKFAPMGSACCFPVEALVFWAIAVCTASTPKSVHVYGDDIICDPRDADAIMSAFRLCGFVPNETKSFVRGPFRESCGGEYFLGEDVTPIRFRKDPARSRANFFAHVDVANNLIAKFHDESSIVGFINQWLGPLPRTSFPIPGTLRLGPSACNDVFFKKRFNKDLQRVEHQIQVPYIRSRRASKPSWNELLRWMLNNPKKKLVGEREESLFPEPGSEKNEPGFYADTRSVLTKRAWVWLGTPDKDLQ